MSDISSWQLIVYPILFILIVGGILAVTTKPFIDNNVPVNKNSLGILNNLHDIAMGDIPNNSTTSLVWTIIAPIPTVIYNFIIPDSVKIYIANDIIVLSYIPNEILIPVVIILTIAILVGIINLIKP